MADAVVETLLKSLTDEMKLRARMIFEAKDELQWMENDLRLLNGFLHDVDRNQDLERQIKELAHDIQDIRESWLIHRAANSNIWRRHLYRIMGLHRLGSKIRSARIDRVDPLFRRIEAYGDLQELQHSTKVNQVPSMGLKNKEVRDIPIKPNMVVGFEEEKKTLIRNLGEETEELDVMSITGMPGIGKTTLAWKIYQDEKIKRKFPTRIWVDIPHDFNSKDWCLCILKELRKAEPQEPETPLDRLIKSTESGRISDHQLFCEVGEYLKNEKFLIVMDNVWTADTLESIRWFLPNKGKILITSRNNHVSRKPYVLSTLKPAESWELLQQEVLGNGNGFPRILIPAAELIAKKCDGSPLAISIVASSLMVPPSMVAANGPTRTEITSSCSMETPTEITSTYMAPTSTVTTAGGDEITSSSMAPVASAGCDEIASSSMALTSTVATAGGDEITSSSMAPVAAVVGDEIASSSIALLSTVATAGSDGTQTEITSSSMVPPSTISASDPTQTEITTCDITTMWWNKVSKNVTKYVTQQNVSERVGRSYTELPKYLQECFLYLGVFPQGYKIPVWTVTSLWIAEGLVQDSWGLSLEETAELNLYDLVSRNLVKVDKVNFDGEIKTCSLHIVMYGFCKYKAAEQEFYHEIKMSGGGAIDGLISLAPYHRCVCINSHLSEFLSTTREERQKVRSLLCLNNEDEDEGEGKVVLHPKDISTIHESFQLLKIFECKGVKFSKFPTRLSKLMNLRYISVSCDDVIPKSISCLCYLETLVVHTESPSIEVKANIWRMLKLRHLVTKAAIVLAIRGKGEAGKNLHTLARLAPACCTKDVFTRAPNLNKLGIRGNLEALSDANSLKKLERLENLKMKHDGTANIIKLALDCFPTTLKRLTLSGTCLKWESMSTLGKIGSLEILKLKNHAFVGESWASTVADGFGCLRFLLIKTTDLKSWVVSDNCFPSLKHLVLNDCKDLIHFPSTPPKNLDKVDVDGEVSESANQFAMEIKEKREQRQRTEPNEYDPIAC